MRICTKEIQEEGVRYRNLNSGDVFVGAHGNKTPMMKTKDGYVYLENQCEQFLNEVAPFHEDILTFYPDACIQLGDPK